MDGQTVLKAMTFNVRYGTANDGENSWPYRRSGLLELIARQNPDVLGVQEALAEQLKAINDVLPDHLVLGVGREDGLTRGEHSAIFYRKSLLGLREGGTRWISETPEVPGSMVFEATNTRVFTWGDFFVAGGGRLLVLNCHIDHESEEARLLGARQMREFIDERADIPVVVMGDFNSERFDPPIKLLAEGGRLAACAPGVGPWGTFHGFRPEVLDGPMIDHILVSEGVQVCGVEIDRSLFDGRAPSDHFPLTATLRL